MDTISNVSEFVMYPVAFLQYVKLLGLLLAGIAVYSIYKVRIYIANNTFNVKRFFIEGWMKWTWAFILGAIVEFLVISIPEVDHLFTSFLGINVQHSVAGALFLGIGLMGLVNNQTKRSNETNK